MQRAGLRASCNAVVKDVPLGVFTTAAPVMVYNPVTNLFEGSAQVFPGTFAANDVAQWSGTAWVPKFFSAVQIAALQNPASATLAVITGLAIALPRAGTYIIDGMLDVTVSVNPTTIAYGMNVSVAPTAMNIGYEAILSATTVIGAQQTGSLAVGGAGVASAAHTIITAAPTTFQGVVVASAACTLQMLASRSANVLTIGARSYIRAQQV